MVDRHRRMITNHKKRLEQTKKEHQEELELARARIEEIQATAKRLQDAMVMFKEAGLPETTLMILLQHRTKLPQKTIRKVIVALDNLYEDYFFIGSNDADEKIETVDWGEEEGEEEDEYEEEDLLQDDI